MPETLGLTNSSLSCAARPKSSSPAARHDHFRWDGIHIVGKSEIGRTTLQVLCMNSDEQLELRMTGESPKPLLLSQQIRNTRMEE